MTKEELKEKSTDMTSERRKEIKRKERLEEKVNRLIKQQSDQSLNPPCPPSWPKQVEWTEHSTISADGQQPLHDPFGALLDCGRIVVISECVCKDHFVNNFSV